MIRLTKGIGLLSGFLLAAHVTAAEPPDKIFKQVENHLNQHNLPEVIHQRHHAAVEQYSKGQTRHGQREALIFTQPAETKILRSPFETAAELQKIWPIAPLSANVRARLPRKTQPSLDDLAATPVVQITPEIKALAEELGNQPVPIFNWVRNEIAFVPSYGAIQGSQQTLLTRRGNAFDTASLLVALFRAANIPARFAYGTVQIPALQVMEWVGGVETPESAMQLLSQGGIPNRAVISGGRISHLILEHLWAEAWVDFIPSRGGRHREGDSWIPLDASFKIPEINTGLEWQTQLTFNPEEIAGQLKNEAADYDETGLTRLDNTVLQNTLGTQQNSLSEWVTNQGIETLGQLLGQAQILELNRPVLTASLPYHLIARVDNQSSLPASVQHHYRFTLYENAAKRASGQAALDYTVSLPQLAGKTLSLSFPPAAQEDEAVINSFLPSGNLTTAQLPKSLPGYLINLKAELRLGQEVVANAGPYVMGVQGLSETIYSPPTLSQARSLSQPIVGEYRAIGMDLQGGQGHRLQAVSERLAKTEAALSTETALTRHEIVGDLLNASLDSYFAANEVYDTWQAQMTEVVAHRAPSMGWARTVLTTDFVVGIPQKVQFNGIAFEIERLDSIAVGKNNTQRFQRQIGKLGSALAHLVLEQTFGQGQQAVSALRAQASALKSGERIYSLNPETAKAILPELSLDASAQHFIEQALHFGMHVTLPENQITLDTWTGRGLGSVSPKTGNSHYPTFGNGGQATGILYNDIGQRLVWASLLKKPVRLAPAIKPQIPFVQSVAIGLIPLATEPLKIGLTDKILTLLTGNQIEQQTGPNLPEVLDEHLFSGLLLEHLSLGQLLDPVPPEIDLQLAADSINPGETLQITATASDNGEITNLTVKINDQLLPLDDNGQATFTSEQPGKYSLIVTATDRAGNISRQESSFRVNAPDDTSPPELVIHSPEDGTEITAPTDFVATITDDSLVSWQLAVKSVSNPGLTILGSGSDPIANQPIATFDPTMLTNGLYQVIFQAVDANGRSTAISNTYRVAGDLKVGNFSFTVEDISIDMMGLPLKVLRTYDTRRKGEALDFGQGWSINYQSIKIEESRVPGKYWTVNTYGRRFNKKLCIEPLGSHQVTITLPSGKVETFEVGISPDCQTAFQGISRHVKVVFKPINGTFSQLEPVDTDGNIYFDGNSLLDPMNDMQFFNPSRYKLTTEAGYEYELDENFGIKSLTDPNGNSLTYTKDGIIHSAGKSILFTRDEQGRITKITDPSGNNLKYQYNTAGDLVSSSDALGNTVRYTYNSTHAMTDIIDPLGRKMVRNLYDDDGRLTGQIDADGNRIHFKHDIEGHMEVFRDLRGFTTTYVYDNRGKIVTEIDAKGNATYRSYDAMGNELTRTDPLGRTTSFSYDAHGNVIGKTSPEGYVTKSAYDEHDNLLREEDAQGNVLSMSYDKENNLLKATDPAGHVFTPVYDNDKRPIATLNGRGKPILSFTFNRDGNPITQTDSLGNITRTTYDASGNELRKLKTRTGADGNRVSFLTTTVYDKNGKPTQTTDAAGYVTSSEYDAAGNVIATFDKNGHKTTFEYDTQGRLIKTDYPDGTSTSSSYDASGNEISFTDRQGRTTQYRYDYKNRLVETVLPDKTSTSREYDAVGRVLAEVDASSNRTTFEYGKGEQPIKITNALEKSIQLTYDGVGNRTSVTDALGKTTRFEYDGVSRPTKVLYADKTFTQVVYDDLGRRVQDIDRAGNVTRYEYDAVGRLTKVIDAKDGETRYLYDEVGNVISETDALRQTTSWTYDNLGRPLSRILPLGMTETFTYDGNGNVLTHTNFNGDTIRYSYDSNNQLVKEIYPDESTISYTYTKSGLPATLTDSRGVTRYSYDVHNQLVKVVHPQGTTLLYNYNANGNRTSVTTPSGKTTYTYDKRGSLKTVIDANGGVTSYSYDVLGNLTSETRPNGTLTQYHYDTKGRLVKVEHLNSDRSVIGSYEYTLNLLGHPTQVIEPNGRIVAYTYDKLGRLIQEKITDPINGDMTLAYSYDAVSNRIEVRVNGVVTGSYSYDANNRLTKGGDYAYSYDASGNTLSQIGPSGTTAYAYDFKNRLVGVTTPNDIMGYVYDADGIRVGRTVNGIATHYLVDKNQTYAQVLEERTAKGDLLASYTYGHDLLSQKRGLENRYFHYDQLGSTKGLTDENQTVTDAYNYEAFGNPLQVVGSTPNHYRFTGEQHDPQTGLIYLRARYYDPKIGRFITQDTWQGQQSKPLSKHKYLYANANPVVFIDPTGYMSIGSLNTAIEGANIMVRLARPNFSYIMKKVIKGKKFAVFKATASLGLRDTDGHHFVYIQRKSFRQSLTKANGAGFCYDIGADFEEEQTRQVIRELRQFLNNGTKCDTIYKGTLGKEYTTAHKIRKDGGQIVGSAKAKFTYVQLMWWEAGAFKPFAADMGGNFTYTFKDSGGWNCRTWTAAALLFAKWVEKMPLYP